MSCARDNVARSCSTPWTTNCRASRPFDLFTTVLQAVVENFDEYRDYNTTTTQSDYGENLYVLFDFLRVKCGYERDNWQLKPLVLVHEVLCRRGLNAEAIDWQRGLIERTDRRAAGHLSELAEVEQRHGVRVALDSRSARGAVRRPIGD